MNASRVAVIITTQDRAGAAATLVERLNEQSRPPDRVFVLGPRPETLGGIDSRAERVTACVMPAGLAALRRHGAMLAEKDHDILVFFDDAFLPSRNWLALACDYLELDAGGCGRVGHRPDQRSGGCWHGY